MAGKLKSESSRGAEKKKRQSITFEMKMKIIMQYENGKTVATISNDLDFSHSTISTILKDKE